MSHGIGDVSFLVSLLHRAAVFRVILRGTVLTDGRLNGELYSETNDV